MYHSLKNIIILNIYGWVALPVVEPHHIRPQQAEGERVPAVQAFRLQTCHTVCIQIQPHIMAQVCLLHTRHAVHGAHVWVSAAMGEASLR
jgi:hypothetical protein